MSNSRLYVYLLLVVDVGPELETDEPELPSEGGGLAVAGLLTLREWLGPDSGEENQVNKSLMLRLNTTSPC